MNKKAIIIGAGISGLSLAYYLRLAGFDTEIYEMNNIPGGLCTTWERKGYKIDGTIHWLIGAKKGSVFNNLWNEIIDINSIDFVHFEHYETFSDNKGNTFNFYYEPEKLKKELIRIAPEDESQINHFCNLLHKFKDFDPPADVTPELMTIFENISFLLKFLKYIPDLNKYLKISLYEYAQNFKNPFLRFIFENLFSPKTALIFVIINLVWFSQGDAAYPVGGSLNFAKLIENSYLKNGGKILYNSPVEHIITEKSTKHHRVKGIILQNGEKKYADLIISAADAHFTLKQMLEDKFTTKKWQKRFDSFKTFSSYIQVSFGIDRKILSDSHSHFIQTSKEYKINDKEYISSFNYRVHNFDPTLAPEEKTLITTMIEVNDWKYWTELRKDYKLYKDKKKEIADFVLEEIEKHTGSFRDYIEMTDISTPATVIRYTNNWHGSYEGWIMNADTGFNSFERQIPGLEGFYLAGQWVEPGGGIPTAFMSGRKTAQIICKNEGKKFLLK